MVRIGHVRVGMHHGGVTMPVAVRLRGHLVMPMRVVAVIVRVRVFMRQRVMRMGVGMPLGQVQQNAAHHQHTACGHPP